MTKRILILGASGTVGTSVLRHLSCDKNFKVTGTYFSAALQNSPSMIRFSVESPDGIRSILTQVQPNVVISALRGDFGRQLITHEITAKYLAANSGKLIYLSTANVFDGDCSQPHYETDPRISDSEYGQFKIQCEDLLQNYLGSRAVLLRIPFVWGQNSPRLNAVKKGCETGQLDVYTDFFSNHVSDLQIARFIQWIIQEDKEGIFHVGTSDVIAYQQFMEQLITAMGMKLPTFVYENSPGTMAVLSKRENIPDELKWNTRQLIQYLCKT